MLEVEFGIEADLTACGYNSEIWRSGNKNYFDIGRRMIILGHRAHF